LLEMAVRSTRNCLNRTLAKFIIFAVLPSGPFKDLHRKEDGCAAADVANRCVVSHDVAMKQFLLFGSAIAATMIVSKVESKLTTFRLSRTYSGTAMGVAL
jgi:hypothetical protein